MVEDGKAQATPSVSPLTTGGLDTFSRDAEAQPQPPNGDGSCYMEYEGNAAAGQDGPLVLSSDNREPRDPAEGSFRR